MGKGRGMGERGRAGGGTTTIWQLAFGARASADAPSLSLLPPFPLAFNHTHLTSARSPPPATARGGAGAGRLRGGSPDMWDCVCGLSESVCGVSAPSPCVIRRKASGVGRACDAAIFFWWWWGEKVRVRFFFVHVSTKPNGILGLPCQPAQPPPPCALLRLPPFIAQVRTHSDERGCEWASIGGR